MHSTINTSRLGARRKSCAVLAAALLIAMGAQVQAQTAPYPNKPVRVVVAFTAGGTTDMIARSVGQQLADKLKQSFVIDNKPGGGGNIGTEFVVRAPADGYTLIVNTVGPMTVNPTLYKKLPYNPLTDLVPVVMIADVPNVLVVNPTVPATTLDDFTTYAKGNPGQLNYGSTGIGTSSHLSGFMLSRRAGFEATHVPYKGVDALNDLLAGRLQFMFATIPSVIQHIQAGRLRAIAVTSTARSRSLPDIPTVAERGFPGFQAGSWMGVFAPKGTPEAVIATLNKAVNEVIAAPAMQAQMIREGADPVGGTPAALGQFTQKEFEKWRALVRESGATAD
jgi:tripartite-type tricarboxylate transporter receptor subunit TctC